MYFSTVLIVFFIVLDVFVYFLRKHQQVDDDGDQKNTSPSFSSGQRYVHEEDKRERQYSSDAQCRRFSLAEIKLATNDFDEGYAIGKGGFGKVYKGKIGLGEGIDVAIKRSHLDSSQGAAEFWAEIDMLSKFRHSHIVSLLGYCEEPGEGEMILVYEYLPNGSLADHLHKRKGKERNSSPLTWVQRLHICIGAARGLDYLHTGTNVQIRVIHRDVKSSNILLDKNLAAKISDFGISRTSPAYLSGTTTNVFTGQIIGTFGYLDAEYFSTHRLTRKSDVYAFGVVLLEVLCGRPALDFTLDEQQHSLSGWAKQCIREGNIGRIIDPHLRGQVPGNCLKEFGQIAYECLRACAKDRPTMTKVLARLEFVLAWTLRSMQSANNRKHIGRAILIEKAWSLFSIKAPTRVSSDTKKLGQSDDSKEKGVTVEQHDASVLESARESGGVANTHQQVVPPSGETILKEFTFSELQSATRNFGQDMVIGEGGFGRVYKGWLDSVTYEPRRIGDKIAVAIKRSKAESAQGLKEWQAELMFLGRISHPNLVKLFGYCWENRDYFLVYEFVPKGSLENHLFRSAEPLPWYTRIKIAIGAAQGLAFLHSTENNVICRDLKSSNILLDQDFNAKISDFGLAKLGVLDGSTHVSTAIAGTYGYMAPEYVATGHLYIKSDIYTFGMVMLEIITGLRAFDAARPAKKRYLLEWTRPFLRDKKRLERIMDPRLEHDYPAKGARKVAELITNCVEVDPKNRPSMEEVVSILQGINAIKMKPNQPKSKTNTIHLSQYHHQNHHWSYLSRKQGGIGWSVSSLRSGFRALIGSKHDHAQTATIQTNSEKWGN
uniref:receptor like protein kinase S.2-like isoform X2 n=1 Tax=Erigeron canadensis TaxID=72917 RepID=UPI001CB995B1|nr:receptor like protein kinase S.2-like isoform X2 [Erigeron canadensis]